MLLIVLAIIALPLLATTVFVVEAVAGTAPSKRALKDAPADLRVTILMPAHDEALIIGAIVDRLAPEIRGWASLLVVADNCIDDTAAIARAHGAEVVERHDPDRRGKGFALDYGRAHLRAVAPDVVIILDADCSSDRASLRSLAASAHAWRLPCQAIYLLKPLPNVSPFVELSSFAFMIKNLIRQRGLQRLAGRTRLVGTGMAFPWFLFDQAPLASANIVEDAELGLALDRAGFPPQLVAAASNWSDPSSTSGTLIQRARWEGGFLALARSQAIPAIGRALASANPRALMAALDLCVPPLALLALVDGITLLFSTALTWILGLPWWPVQLLLSLSIAAAVAVLAAWVLEGRTFIRAATLLRIPLYVLWKIPLYLGLARRTPREWLRPGR